MYQAKVSVRSNSDLRSTRLSSSGRMASPVNYNSSTILRDKSSDSPMKLEITKSKAQREQEKLEHILEMRRQEKELAKEKDRRIAELV